MADCFQHTAAGLEMLLAHFSSVTLAQSSLADGTGTASVASAGRGDGTRAHMTDGTDAAGTGEPQPRSLLPLVSTASLEAIARQVTDAVRSFCIEKHGVASEVDITTTTARTRTPAPATISASPFSFVGVPQHASFILSELLKNALNAHIERYGAVGVDDAPPIRMHVSSNARFASALICDAGGGFPVEGTGGDTRTGTGGTARDIHSAILDRVACVRLDDLYFRSSARGRAEPNYQYSREFGASFTGHGLGLARSRIYARLLGGELSIQSVPGLGCNALLVIERSGDWGSDLPPAEERER